jgi:hypothetical protein
MDNNNMTEYLDSPIERKRKTWSNPEIRDQTITSATQVKTNNPSESSPNTGPVS